MLIRGANGDRMVRRLRSPDLAPAAQEDTTRIAIQSSLLFLLATTARANFIPPADRSALRKSGYGKAYQEMNAAIASMPIQAYRDSVGAWLARTRHSRFDVPLTDLFYLAMLELKDLLIASGFQVWLVTGAAQDFVRSCSEDVLGIPPGQAIGSWT